MTNSTDIQQCIHKASSLHKRSKLALNVCRRLPWLYTVGLNMWVELGVGALAAVLLLLLYDVIRPTNYPPGPGWLPVVGNLLMFYNLRKKLGFTHLVWSRLAEIYGPVTGLRLGRDLIVIVSGQQHIKEVSIKDDFDGRPDGFFFRLRSYGERLGIIFTFISTLSTY
ncbi:hypothetical protein J6590_001832 [Homalodisca vitripennis]|nr:hypothetical protein J6590_001832 [Homalodisca vitripennis]